MLGTLDPDKKEVLVVGGGMAGLLAAYRLDQKGYRVSLIEAQDRLGGIIETRHAPEGLVESGPHSLLATAPVHALCRDLDVELLPVQPDSRSRFILRGGKMRRFPLTIGESARLAGQILRTARSSHSPPSLGEWGRIFLGEAALDYLLTPFTKGIYGAHPDELSLRGAFPSLEKGLLRLLRERVRAPNSDRPRMMAPRLGMGELTRALEKRLRERILDRINLETRANAEMITADKNVIITVPADAVAPLIQSQAPELAERLKLVTYTPLVCVTVFAKKSQFKKIPRGVGVLMPEKESRNILGVLFNSSAFSERTTNENFTSCTVMLGGSRRPELASLTDVQIVKLIQLEWEEIFGFTGKVISIDKSLDETEVCRGQESNWRKSENKNVSAAPAYIHRWPRAIPLYNENLRQVWELAQKTWCSTPGRVLFGNYTGKVSIRAMIETEIG